GLSPPAWCSSLDDAQQREGAATATPTCESGVTACVERSDHVILARQLPEPPTLTVPGQSSSVTLPWFSATSVTVFLGPPAQDGGDAVESYRFEWDTRADFSSANKQVQV